MSCKLCATGHCTIVATYSAGSTRADKAAAHRAQEEREKSGAKVHVHYAAESDRFVVARADR